MIANLGVLSPVFESLVQDVQEMASGLGVDDTKAKQMMQQRPQKGKHHWNNPFILPNFWDVTHHMSGGRCNYRLGKIWTHGNKDTVIPTYPTPISFIKGAGK